MKMKLQDVLASVFKVALGLVPLCRGEMLAKPNKANYVIMKVDLRYSSFDRKIDAASSAQKDLLKPEGVDLSW